MVKYLTSQCKPQDNEVIGITSAGDSLCLEDYQSMTISSKQIEVEAINTRFIIVSLVDFQRVKCYELGRQQELLNQSWVQDNNSGACVYNYSLALFLFDKQPVLE